MYMQTKSFVQQSLACERAHQAKTVHVHTNFIWEEQSTTGCSSFLVSLYYNGGRSSVSYVQNPHVQTVFVVPPSRFLATRAKGRGSGECYKTGVSSPLPTVHEGKTMPTSDERLLLHDQHHWCSTLRRVSKKELDLVLEPPPPPFPALLRSLGVQEIFLRATRLTRQTNAREGCRLLIALEQMGRKHTHTSPLPRKCISPSRRPRDRYCGPKNSLLNRERQISGNKTKPKPPHSSVVRWGGVNKSKPSRSCRSKASMSKLEPPCSCRPSGGAE